MKLVDVAIYLVYIATYIIIVPILIGIYFFYHLSKILRILLGGLAMVFVLDLLLLLFNLKEGVTFFYLFSIVDVLMMSWLFSLTVTNKSLSKIILILGILFVPFIGLDAFFISGLTNKGFSNAVEKFYIMVVAIYYLTQLFQDKVEVDLIKQPMFWISVGIMIYNLIGSFDIFSDPIINYSQTLYLQYYIVWSIVTVFMYGAFSYAFRLSRNAYRP